LFILSTLSCKLIRKKYDRMDVLVAKGVFFLVTIGAFVILVRIFWELVKNRFSVEKLRQDKF
jgi:hypothetical protein